MSSPPSSSSSSSTTNQNDENAGANKANANPPPEPTSPTKRRRFIMAEDEEEMAEEMRLYGDQGGNRNNTNEDGETYERVNEDIPSDHSDAESNPDVYQGPERNVVKPFSQ